MIKRYLALSDEEKRELLSQTAIRLGVDPVIVEKRYVPRSISAVRSLRSSNPFYRRVFRFQRRPRISRGSRFTTPQCS